MATSPIRIVDLPSASGVTSADYLPIVQDGQTKKFYIKPYLESRLYDFIDFNTLATGIADVPGRLYWNADEGTLNLAMPNSVQQIGMEVYYRVKNQTGSTITNGSVVMAAGAVGNSGHLLVEKALASTAILPDRVMGVMTHDIANGADGYATHFGLVRQIDTTGGAEAWADGDILYLSHTTPGALTKTPPPAPYPRVTVALVVHAHANGQLFVRPSISHALDDLHDVDATGATTGQILVKNGSGVWEKQSLKTVNGQNLVGTGDVDTSEAAQSSTYTYTSGNLSRIDYADGSYKQLVYSGADLDYMDYVVGAVTTRKTYVRDGSGNLTGITVTTF